jgi:predicted amidohydrolase YtcJ
MKAFVRSWTLCIALFGAATAFAADVALPQVNGPADTIFFNGTVVTVGPASMPAEVNALAVANGVIIAVGDKASVMRTFEEGKTKLVDLQGKTLMPGFVEPHTHAVMTAFNVYLATDVSSFAPAPTTIEDVQNALTAALPGVPKGGWLLAAGFDPSRTSPFMDSLDAVKLDEVSETVPIFVVNQSGHLAYVNHKAIELAKLTPDSKADFGRYEVKEKDGVQYLTGVLEEAGAYKPFQELVAHCAPMKAKMGTDAQLAALKKTYNSFAKAGVTTATEISLGLVTGSIANEYKLLKTMALDPLTPVRIRAYISADVVTDKQPIAIPQYGPNELLKVIGIKFVADGSTQGLTAKLNAHYDYPKGTVNTGSLNYELKPLVDKAKGFMNDGWQLAIHSNGDGSTSQVLKAYAEILGIDDPGTKPSQEEHDRRAQRRWRIEHLTVTDEDQLQTIWNLGLSPSMTNGHVYYWGYAFGDKDTDIIGWDRAQRIDPARSLKDRDVHFSFNSDSPVTPVSPLRYMATGVTREWQHAPGVVMATKTDDQRIEVDEAIRAVTMDAAYQLFLEKEIGSLEVGKRADLVILAKNPRAMKDHAQEIMDIEVLATYLSGEQKYRSTPLYGSLQNVSNAEYRCNRASHLATNYTAPDCLMRFIPVEKGAYAIQNLKTCEFFQSSITTMSKTADTDKQRWTIVAENGHFTVQNLHNGEFMTSAASQLSKNAGAKEFWSIDERPRQPTECGLPKPAAPKLAAK